MLIHIDSISENSDSRETDALILQARLLGITNLNMEYLFPVLSVLVNSFPHISLGKTRPELTEAGTHIDEGHLLFIRQLKSWLKVYPVKSVLFFFSNEDRFKNLACFRSKLFTEPDSLPLIFHFPDI